MRGRGGRRRESYTPYSAPDYKDGGTAAGQTAEEMLKEATPSQVRGRGEKTGTVTRKSNRQMKWRIQQGCRREKTKSRTRSRTRQRRKCRMGKIRENPD